MIMKNLPTTYKSSFSIYTDLFRWIGLDIFGVQNKINSSIRQTFFAFLAVTILMSQLYFTNKLSSDQYSVGVFIPTDLTFVLILLQMIKVLSSRNELRKIIIEIGDLWPKQPDDGERGVQMKSWLRRVGLLKAYYISNVINTIYATVSPFIVTCYFMIIGADKFTLVLPTIWKVDSVASYLLSYLWQTLAMSSGVICLYMPFNILMVVIAGNISILFRTLHVDLENAIKRNSSGHGVRDIGNSGLSKQVLENQSDEIVRIIIQHQKLLRIVPRLNDVFGSVILAFVTISSVFISFSGFRIVAYGGLNERRSMYSSYSEAESVVLLQHDGFPPIYILDCFQMINSSFGIFMMAYAGQLLHDSSSGLADAAYNSLWYESDLKVRKLVLFIIVRSQCPSYLSVFGLSNMTLPYFTKVMSTAWTYFSLLNQLYSSDHDGN